jgi:nitrite reductase (NADH) large subunit
MDGSPNQNTYKPRLVVVGNGMVGHRFVQAAAERGLQQQYELVVISEEARLAYDRVNLSKWFEARSDEALQLTNAEEYSALGARVVQGDPVTAIQRATRSLRTASGRAVHYDKLVIATGSYPFVPPVPGRDLPGCFVYRTIDDLTAIAAAAATAQRGVVIGGGLLGLEAANALKLLGLETHVVELGAHLMPLQLDAPGGAALRARIEELGVQVHLSAATTEVLADEHGHACALRFADGRELATNLVIFSAGIRARDELARACGLQLGERGGVAIDAACRSSDPDIFAIGECASFAGKTYGLVAPGYRMAEVAAANLSGETAGIGEFDLSTKLKLLGIDVGSFGDALAQTPGSHVLSVFDGATSLYKKLVLSPDKKQLLGGVLVGDATAYSTLTTYVRSALPLPARPSDLIITASGNAGSALGADSLPDAALICSCHNIDKGAICSAIREQGLQTIAAVKACTKAGTGCGSCVTLVTDLLKRELKSAGIAVKNHVCEHFAYSRQELLHLVRVHSIRSFEALITQHGQGGQRAGCEICKPLVASLMASSWNEHILERKHVGLQDTNDRFLANMQRDGSYSVVPRLPGGEVTPDQLIAIGAVAKQFGLYTKITGGQRVDMFGARLDQLPAIWQALIDAGLESGHAYGKALRTVKSCVGSTWCRYGVQDSLDLAVKLEQRYRGLRSPHKLKGAVSGCARECAEAQGKDFGAIATDKGYNLYVCGNGGMKPQHAQLLAVDLDEPTVIRYLDRFLMFYVRTADRLQRTASWLNNLEGGLDYVKSVVIDDSLGMAAELETDMAAIVASYECEWRATLADPVKLQAFRPFVNCDTPDPSIVFVAERAQHRPASWAEKQAVPARRRLVCV